MLESVIDADIHAIIGRHIRLKPPTHAASADAVSH